MPPRVVYETVTGEAEASPEGPPRTTGTLTVPAAVSVTALRAYSAGVAPVTASPVMSTWVSALAIVPPTAE